MADAGRAGFLASVDLMGRVRVVQALSAGVDWIAGRVPDGVVVCNARGVYDGPLAEWVVGAILATERGLLRARDAQAQGGWRGFVPPGELDGSRVVILGHGSIGSAVAARLRPFGAEVVGVGRTSHDGLRGFHELDAVLPDADVLVNLLPLTRATIGLVDGRLLGRLPDGALIVNAGRGRTTVMPALVAELASGRLGPSSTSPTRSRSRPATRCGHSRTSSSPRTSPATRRGRSRTRSPWPATRSGASRPASPGQPSGPLPAGGDPRVADVPPDFHRPGAASAPGPPRRAVPPSPAASSDPALSAGAGAGDPLAVSIGRRRPLAAPGDACATVCAHAYSIDASTSSSMRPGSAKWSVRRRAGTSRSRP